MMLSHTKAADCELCKRNDEVIRLLKQINEKMHARLDELKFSPAKHAIIARFLKRMCWAQTEALKLAELYVFGRVLTENEYREICASGVDAVKKIHLQMGSFEEGSEMEVLWEQTKTAIDAALTIDTTRLMQTLTEELENKIGSSVGDYLEELIQEMQEEIPR